MSCNTLRAIVDKLPASSVSWKLPMSCSHNFGCIPCRWQHTLTLSFPIIVSPMHLVMSQTQLFSNIVFSFMLYIAPFASPLPLPIAVFPDPYIRLYSCMYLLSWISLEKSTVYSTPVHAHKYHVNFGSLVLISTLPPSYFRLHSISGHQALNPTCWASFITQL